jgi:hypothetical protein
MLHRFSLAIDAAMLCRGMNEQPTFSGALHAAKN